MKLEVRKCDYKSLQLEPNVMVEIQVSVTAHTDAEMNTTLQMMRQK
jgi:hypothetical protein